MPHKELNSKEDFDAAIGESGKFVLVLAYVGEVHPKAEELVEKFASSVSSYKVDVAKQPTASKGLGVSAEDAPAVVIFKDGKKIETVKGVNAETASKITAAIGA